MVAATRGRPPAGPSAPDESIKDALQQALDEARMVLPGVQALFGFQLIAVFNEGFGRDLSEAEQMIHLAAIVLVAIAIALLMTPAAYHRQVEPRRASAYFVQLASRLISGAMMPLALGLALDLHLVGRLVSGSPTVAAAIAGVVFLLFVGLWFAFPQWRSAQLQRRGRG